jgi:phosphoribosylformylglycinamidine synthase
VKIAVVVFPGSNADFDALHVARDVLGADARYVFHKETSLGDADAVILPGGFAHGDYLRCGAIARFSPIAADVGRFADRGGPVLGICNGFQVLTEMHLLPGALTRNAHLKFECGDIQVRVESSGAWTAAIPLGTELRLPIAHAEGRYQATPETLQKLTANGQIALRYSTPPRNGSVDSIAGVYNEKKNVLGLMPHPERASEEVLGNTDGFRLFESLKTFLSGGGSR